MRALRYDYWIYLWFHSTQSITRLSFIFGKKINEVIIIIIRFSSIEVGQLLMNKVHQTKYLWNSINYKKSCPKCRIRFIQRWNDDRKCVIETSEKIVKNFGKPFENVEEVVWWIFEVQFSSFRFHLMQTRNYFKWFYRYQWSISSEWIVWDGCSVFRWFSCSNPQNVAMYWKMLCMPKIIPQTTVIWLK